MSVSTVPAAKAWLFGQLVAALAAEDDATFGVTYADAVDSANNPDDMVWLGDVSRTVQPWTMTGGLTVTGSLQEAYDLTVNVNCYRGGDQPEIVEARGWALIAEIEAVVRADPTFGGLLIRSWPTETTASVAWDEEFKGRLCSIPLTISCLASL
jgi:hypothetical protein